MCFKYIDYQYCSGKSRGWISIIFCSKKLHIYNIHTTRTCLDLSKNPALIEATESYLKGENQNVPEAQHQIRSANKFADATVQQKDGGTVWTVSGRKCIFWRLRTRICWTVVTSSSSCSRWSTFSSAVAVCHTLHQKTTKKTMTKTINRNGRNATKWSTFTIQHYLAVEGN